MYIHTHIYKWMLMYAYASTLCTLALWSTRVLFVLFYIYIDIYTDIYAHDIYIQRMCAHVHTYMYALGCTLLPHFTRLVTCFYLVAFAYFVLLLLLLMWYSRYENIIWRCFTLLWLLLLLHIRTFYGTWSCDRAILTVHRVMQRGRIPPGGLTWSKVFPFSHWFVYMCVCVNSKRNFQRRATIKI